MKKPLLIALLIVLIGLSVYFIFLDKVIIGVVLFLLSGWVDFKIMRQKKRSEITK